MGQSEFEQEVDLDNNGVYILSNENNFSEPYSVAYYNLEYDPYCTFTVQG